MPDLSSRPVRMVFTSRAGGVSAAPYDSFNLGTHVGDDAADVAANRARLAQILGLPEERFVWMEQLHTNTVTLIDGPSATPVEATDAIVTREKNLALCVLVADCTPVLLSDHTAGVIGAAHAGRMGARNGIVKNTVEAMVGLGAEPSRIQVLLGPAAAGESYEVPEGMALDVEKHLPGSRTRTKKGTPGIDVRAGLVRQLMSLGVTHIDADPRDTITDKDFFSHRREGVTGRQAGVIWMPNV
ncbi:MULTISPECIES: peptidoglycan editing factor PgeF [Corynebacterium]|uniref:Purine nucleoside phosphorylase n=1 Tax=Corynebacterium haemomassiliense TaxID=2754726 RepID=A0A7W2EAL0_9CORY|nr:MULTISPECIES: peptidoglycan editing factor PgeF [Corynebacterium]MBA5244062.1 peptidoglycan editing factor PgeF [Corynebacterium haemomassiliense]MDL0402293.1 peptidoglycan editing factor PgeF [Corynebacterium lehmanniae]